MSTNRKAELDGILVHARSIAEAAKAANRMLTPAEAAEVDQLLEKAGTIRAELKADAHHASLPSVEAFDNLRLGSKSGRGMRWTERRVGSKAILAEGSYASIADSLLLFGSMESPARIADLFDRSIEGTASVLSYMRQVDPVDNYGPASGSWDELIVAHLGDKPTSRTEFERIDDEFKTYAVLSPEIAVQDLADAPRLSEEVGAALVSEVLEALDADVYSEVATAAGAAESAADDELSSIRRGMRVLAERRIPTSTVWAIVNPSDHETLDTAKASDSGVFLNGAAPTATPDRLFGVRLIPSIHADSGTAIVFAPRVFGRLVIRQAPTVEFDGGGERFTSNAVVGRAEMRGRLAIARPAAAVAVQL